MRASALDRRTSGNGGAAWPVCGLVGGGMAGILDSLGAVAAEPRATGIAEILWLAFIGANLGMAVGGVLGLLAGRLAAPRSPADERARATRIRLGPELTLAMLIAAPFVLHAGFVLAHPEGIPRTPAMTTLSLALLGAGVVLTYAAARFYGEVLRSGNRRGRWLASLALVLGAAGLHRVDRGLAGDLCPWCQASLSAVVLLILIFAARLAIRNVRSRVLLLRDQVLWRRLTVLALGAASAGAGLSLWKLRDDQSLRSYAYERTRLTALVLRIPPAWSMPSEGE